MYITKQIHSTVHLDKLILISKHLTQSNHMGRPVDTTSHGYARPSIHICIEFKSQRQICLRLMFVFNYSTKYNISLQPNLKEQPF